MWRRSLRAHRVPPDADFDMGRELVDSFALPLWE